MSNPSDLESIIEKERNRLKQAQIAEEISRDRQKKRKKLVKIGIVTVVIAALAVGSILMYSHHMDVKLERYLAETGMNTSMNAQGIDLSRTLQRRAERRATDEVKAYNEGKVAYDDVRRTIDLLEVCEGTEEYAKHISKVSELLEELHTSKTAFITAYEYIGQGQYLAAVEQFIGVSESDTNYTEAQEQIEILTDSCVDELTVIIASDITDGLDGSISLLEKAKSLYPNNPDISGMNAALKDCGNPFIYTLSQMIASNIETIEIDSGLSSGRCSSLAFIYVSDTKVIVESYFNEHESSAHRFSFVISITGFSRLERSEYADILYELGETPTVKFDWNKSVYQDDKLSAIYKQLVKFGPSYSGDAEDVGSFILLSKEIDEDMQDGTSYKTEKQSLFQMVLLLIFTVVVIILLMRYAIKSLFG